MRMTPKRLKALRLRNAALSKVRAEGKFQETNIGHVLSWSGNGLAICLRTPFNSLPPVPDAVSYEASLRGVSVGNRPYGLDIWEPKGVGKVLNIEWSDNDEVDLVTFRRGDWEAKVIAFDSER